MKKILLIALIALASCNHQAQEIRPTLNTEFKVELLFEVDGCRVYRFEDSRYRYFTNCNGSVSWTEKHGKTSHDVDVTTSNYE